MQRVRASVSGNKQSKRIIITYSSGLVFQKYTSVIQHIAVVVLLRFKYIKRVIFLFTSRPPTRVGAV